MISNFNRKATANDRNLLIIVIITVLIAAWLCTPPGNKFLQICFWGNNTRLFIAKLTKNYNDEYVFHRNNAIYLAKMFPEDKHRALIEMNKAIETFPSYEKEEKLKELYRERAEIYLFLGNYKAALGDFIHSEDIKYTDYLKVALLFNEIGRADYAMSYCDAILKGNSEAFAGFACRSKIYQDMGQYDKALEVWDLAEYNKVHKYRVYAEKARIKKLSGDEIEAEEYMAKAKELNSAIDYNQSIIDSTLHPKILALPIKNDIYH